MLSHKGMKLGAIHKLMGFLESYKHGPKEGSAAEEADESPEMESKEDSMGSSMNTPSQEQSIADPSMHKEPKSHVEMTEIRMLGGVHDRPKLHGNSHEDLTANENTLGKKQSSPDMNDDQVDADSTNLGHRGNKKLKNIAMKSLMGK